jgi:hypothetical protein
MEREDLVTAHTPFADLDLLLVEAEASRRVADVPDRAGEERSERDALDERIFAALISP